MVVMYKRRTTEVIMIHPSYRLRVILHWFSRRRSGICIKQERFLKPMYMTCVAKFYIRDVPSTVHPRRVEHEKQNQVCAKCSQAALP